MVSELIAKAALQRVEANSIAERHPVRLLLDIYETEINNVSQTQLPNLEPILEKSSADLLSHCLILEPINGELYIDFITVSKGANIPGIETEKIKPGELYTHTIEPRFAPERLLELASCIVLKTHQLTKAASARPSTLNVKVYRGVFPVWQVERGKSAVILMIAPRYVEL